MDGIKYKPAQPEKANHIYPNKQKTKSKKKRKQIKIELLLQNGQRKFCGVFLFDRAIDRDRTTLITTDNLPL